MAPTLAASLRKSSNFASLSDAEAESLAEAARIIRVAKDQLIFSRGDEAQYVYLVVSGLVAIEMFAGNGRSVRVATLPQGAVFGELAAIDGLPRSASARSLEATELIAIARPAYQHLLQTNAAFASVLVRDLTSKLRQTDLQLEDISFRSLKSRLAELLYKFATDGGRARGVWQITQTELADRLGATREKVNAHLQEFQSVGAVNLSRGKITFVAAEKLRAFF